MESTVGDLLRKLAEEVGLPFETYVETWVGGRVEPSVPERYRRLLREVVLRLPEGWDDHAVWMLDVGPESGVDLARVRPREDDAGELVTPYDFQIFPSQMDHLSDPACRWVFAHELAHIASKLRCGSVVIDGTPYTKARGDEYVPAPRKKVHEDAADNIALGWGFELDYKAFLDEAGASK